MDINKNHNHYDQKSHPNPPFLTPGNTVAIYTILSILRRMKRELGIEAMHEYIENYCRVIEENNPKFNEAVKHALRLMNVEKLYQNAMEKEKK
ncbi:MAG: hypothetical protein K8R46_14580 [Pirellulales bacterium]|nr:hypothetical protein [Pirellulales bacterium]